MIRKAVAPKGWGCRVNAALNVCVGPTTDGRSGPKISGVASTHQSERSYILPHALGAIWPAPGFISLFNGRHNFLKLRAATWSW
jgi:hypothetical protein